jgi:hypothetical protein
VDFVERGSGLNYRDAEGDWHPTREEFQRTADGGFLAEFGPHRLALANNINSLAAVDFLDRVLPVCAPAPRTDRSNKTARATRPNAGWPPTPGAIRPATTRCSATIFTLINRSAGKCCCTICTSSSPASPHNNVLKTRGYHLEHNFGHGKKHLSSLLLTMNLLAFALHTLLEVTDASYRLVRAAVGARRKFFQHLEALTAYWYFENWERLMDFMMRGQEVGPYAAQKN